MVPRGERMIAPEQATSSPKVNQVQRQKLILLTGYINTFARFARKITLEVVQLSSRTGR